MRRRLSVRLRSVVRALAAGRDRYFEFLERVANAAHRQQMYVIAAATMLLGYSIIFQSVIESAGFAWVTTSMPSWFTLALAFAVLGGDMFNRSQGKGGSPSPRTSSAG